MRFRKGNSFTNKNSEEPEHLRPEEDQQEKMTFLLSSSIATGTTTMTRRYSRIIGCKRKSKSHVIRFLAFVLLISCSFYFCFTRSRHFEFSISDHNAIPVLASSTRVIDQTVESPNDILLIISSLHKEMERQRVGGLFGLGSIGSSNSNAVTAARGVTTTTTAAANTITTTLTGRYLYPCTNENTVQNGTKHSIFCHVQFPFIDLSDFESDEVSLRNLLRNGLSFSPDVDLATNTGASLSSPLSPTIPTPYAVLTKRGYKGGLVESQINQDRPFIFHDYLNSPRDAGHFVMGIMDGHGTFGHLVAQFVLMEFIRELLVNQFLVLFGKDMQDEHNYKRKWVELFQKIDQKLPKEMVDDGGCTASLIAKLSKDTIVVANTGDSQTFIVGYQKKPTMRNTEESLLSSSSSTMTASSLNVTILYRSRQHKAHILEERARIESAGGVVELPQSIFGTEMSSRVLVPIINAGAIMSLAMSRSFGDALAKAVGVIVDPTIDVLRTAELRKHYKGGLGNNGTILLDHDEDESIQMFAVSVSDGLFDKVPIEEIAQYLAVALESDDNGGSLYKACEELITKSSNIWLEKSSMFGQSYRDDISIAVHRL